MSGVGWIMRISGGMRVGWGGLLHQMQLPLPSTKRHQLVGILLLMLKAMLSISVIQQAKQNVGQYRQLQIKGIR
jgi:hypothetical protein